MINHIYKPIIQVANLFLYLISKLIPGDPNIWVFGAWFGEKYADNSKYLFEYVANNHPEIRAIWLSKNKEAFTLIKEKEYEVYYTYSLKGYFYSAKALFGFTSTGFDDLNTYIPIKYVINLWHGFPLKKITYDDNISFNNLDTLARKIINSIFVFKRLPSDFAFTCASSKEEAMNLCTAFRVDMRSILITGLPRNDVFIQRNINPANTKAIYMPTHRNEGELDIASLFHEDMQKINTRLMQNNITLFIKLHFYHLDNAPMSNQSNIIFLRDEDITQDIYSILNDFDLLITDYSSVYIDYLLSDRPIIFSPFDIESYLQNDREMYFEYDDVTPGPKCNTWKEVTDWMIKLSNDPLLFAEERKLIKDRFHKHQNGRFCERVFNEISKHKSKLLQ